MDLPIAELPLTKRFSLSWWFGRNPLKPVPVFGSENPVTEEPVMRSASSVFQPIPNPEWLPAKVEYRHYGDQGLVDPVINPKRKPL